ncbi:MAG TPA: prenyltransferase/squalene oxidase repeat-containing protein [archaeon]|nr:prenyltransferase/squalene oxidase repeat-containing protein [archaeon]
MRLIALILIAGTALFSGCKGGQKETVKPAAAQAAVMHPTAEWILACRAGEGGFGCYPGDSAFTSRTGMALEALASLGELGTLSGKDQLAAWIKARQLPDGGFFEADDYYYGKKLPWGSISALEPTYWAVRALALLGDRTERPEAAARFIGERRSSNGGYAAYEYSWGGAKEGLYTTFWAVAALRELGLPVPDSAKTVEWVRSMQDTRALRGGFALSNDYFNYSSVSGTYYAVRTLDLLGAGPRRHGEVRKFLFSSYGQEPDGGFELGHGDNWNNFDHYSRMQDTYGAVFALEILGTSLSDHDTSRAARPAADCAAWIVSVQNPDGGFGRLGVTDQTPLRSPSEMMATWQAVRTLELLGQPVPRPLAVIKPVPEVKIHKPLHSHPVVDCSDPCEVWAYRRIALPIYNHYLEKTGSKIKALGMVSRWVRAAVGPENGAWITGGRGILMHEWGQCGAMSWLLQGLITSIDHASRGSFVIGDVNCEILITEQGWDAPHWCLFIPFTNEYPDPGIPAPDGERNGWSVLDMVVNHRLRHLNLDYPSRTVLGDHLFAQVRIESIDAVKGEWGTEYNMDSLTTYSSPVVESLYPEGSW